MSINRIYNRNPFDPSAPRDSEIMDRCTSIDISLHKDRDLDIHSEVTIRCGSGLWGTERESLDPDVWEQRQKETMRFIARLLSEFAERKPDDGHAAAEL